MSAPSPSARNSAAKLKAANVDPASVTDVVLIHAHWDHSVNYTLFPNADVWIGKVEMDWATQVPVGFNPLPELSVQDLARHPKLHLLEDGERFLDGFTAHLCPGHTPGCLVYRLEGNDVPVVFSGDAAEPPRAAVDGDRHDHGCRRQPGPASTASGGSGGRCRARC